MAALPGAVRVWTRAGFGFEQWLAPTIAAVVALAALAPAGRDAASMRGLVFVMGPLLLLSGLASRLHGFLHAPERLRLLPLPLPGAVHWRAAQGAQSRGLAFTAFVGALSIGAAAAPALPWHVALGLVADWLWLCVLAALVEPWAPALAAWLGRRFDADGPARRLQARLGGGFTLPEATAHLYLPPLVLGMYTALAMPGQLWIDRVVDGLSVPPAFSAAALGALALAALARPFAARPYARAVFEAVPWLAQATRTLAGPPTPAPVPAFVLRTRDPGLRLFALQLWRTTPVPGLRLGALVCIAAWIGLVAGVTLPRAAVVVALATAWVIPGLRVLLADAAARAAVFEGRPGPDPMRRARPPAAWLWLLAPVVVAAMLLGLGLGGRA